MIYHEPVLLYEVIEGLKVCRGKRFIDATVGGGGHGIEIINLGGELLGIDVDPEAVTYTREKLEVRGKKLDEEKRGNWKIVQGNFKDIEKIAKENGFYPVDGALFDLGVSSHQLDEETRGFSYKYAGSPFDLRLNQKAGKPATEIINQKNEKELKAIIGVFSEEEHCGPIAHALVDARRVKPVKTTGDVCEVIHNTVGEKRANETASRVFQAFRIVVNDELKNLKIGLQGARNLVRPGGRIAVISFHSLEDRIVKQFFKESEFHLITKKPIIPTLSERQKNKRSRSAKLRIAEIV